MDEVEFIHLLIAVLMVSMGFSIVFGNVYVSFVVVGLAFFFHELAHRWTAVKMGAHAEYRLWFPGLVAVLVLTVLTKIVFAAPGGVVVRKPHLSKYEEGVSSAAGAVMNLVLALVFLSFAADAGLGWFRNVSVVAFNVNMAMAVFNLLPLHPLDGFSVYEWSSAVWSFLMGLSVFVFFYFGAYVPVGV